MAVVHASGSVEWQVLRDAEGVLARAEGCGALGVDIPMGLPRHAYRRCDLEARQRLGRRASSVFPAPVRRLLDASDYAEARRISLADRGKSLSRQTWNLVPKIRQWDAMPPRADVFEVHPEVSFTALSPDTVFAAKSSARGLLQRLAVLSRWLDVRKAFADPRADAGMDDMLDALAVAWSAMRWMQGVHEVLGDEVDATGRLMRIVV